MERLHGWGGVGDRTPESFVCCAEGFVCGVAGSDRTLQQRLFAMAVKVLIGWRRRSRLETKPWRCATKGARLEMIGLSVILSSNRIDSPDD